MPAVKRQAGMAGATVIIIVILGLVALILGARIFDSQLGLNQREVTDANMRRVTDALVNFASLNQRLPCPANGDGADGAEAASPAGPPTAVSPSAYTTCAYGDGVVPWLTLAIRQEHALDGWGRRISYRVFSGTSGVTQLRFDSLSAPPRIVGGASNVDCNTSLGAPIDTTLAAGNLCKPATGPPPLGSPPPNTPAQFLAAPGRTPLLVVQDQGTTRNSLAFVLVSHGESGYGAFSANGGAGRAQSPSGAGKEIVNAGAGGEYWILPHSQPEVGAADPAHFDDVLTYMTFAELVVRANLKARSWSRYPLGTQFSGIAVQSAVVAAGGSFDASSSQNTGQSSLGLGGFLVTASAGSSTQNIGYRDQGGIGGIGVIGGSSSSGDLNSTFNERLRFQLGEGSGYGKMDVALNAFEVTDFSPLQKERAEISLWKQGDPVQTSTVDAWEESGDPTRCLYRLVTGNTFDRLDVAPVSQTGGGGSTRFTVAAIMACTDATTPCLTNVSGALGCPMSPPSTVANAPSAAGTTTATLSGVVEDNGVSHGTGTGYTTTAAGFPFGTRSIPLVSGSGTILAGNCVQFSGDANTYVVAYGISAPGTLFLSSPGLRQAIPASTRAVSFASCPTAVQFDYGPTCAYGSSAPATPATIAAGSGSTNVSASISGLSCGSSYYMRTRATNSTGTTTSANRQFRTANCAVATPTAQTNPATTVTSTSATLVGIVNDNGSATTASFEYGESSCYGSSTGASPGSVAANAGVTAVVATVASLKCDTYYHYRVIATSGSGTMKGDDAIFRTAACP